MGSEKTSFGQLLTDYLFVVGETETHLADEIGLSLNKVSAAIHGKYRLKRDHFDRVVIALTNWGMQLTEEERADLLAAWRRSTRKVAHGDAWMYRDAVGHEPIVIGGGVAATLSNMPAEEDPAASARLALAQGLGRVYDRILDQGCEGLLMAIAQSPDSQEKVERLQALEILNDRVARFAQQNHLTEVASSARVWATLARLTAKSVWGHLAAPGTPTPAANETVVLVDFMDDAELMGILGLQPGWTPDLKVIDPDPDLKATDLGEWLS